MTDLFLNINDIDEYKSKRIIVRETLLDNFPTDVSESKRNIVNETLS